MYLIQNVVYLDRRHHYNSVFLRDLDSNSPDRMFGFLFVHRAHMTHYSLTSHSSLKKLNEIIMSWNTNANHGKYYYVNSIITNLGRQPLRSSVFLRDHHLNILDHMFVFLFYHQAHKIHCIQSSRSKVKKLNEIKIFYQRLIHVFGLTK